MKLGMLNKRRFNCFNLYYTLTIIYKFYKMNKKGVIIDER